MTAKHDTWWQTIRNPLAVVGIIVACALGIALIVVIVLGYMSNWHWTGLVPETSEPKQHAKTLWDWLQLLVIPAALFIGGFWLNRIQKEREKKQEKRAEQKRLLRELDSNIIQAYNAAKRVRRLLRAMARCLSPDQQETMIMIEPYDKQMQALIDIQLQFETFKEEVNSNPTLFSGKAETLKQNLGYIEDYLNCIVKEYENNYKMRTYNNAPTFSIFIGSVEPLPKALLSDLREFIGPHSDAIDFQQKFQIPAGKVMGDLRDLLTSE